MTRALQFSQTLIDLSSSYEKSAIMSSYLRTYEEPGEKIDYSDFKNFCWFSNSRNLYNIWLYKLYNWYDKTFSWDEYHIWHDELSGYEKHCLDTFPSYRGYFLNSGSNSCSYVEGIDYENKMSLTSSNNALSIEFCCSLSASNVPSMNANQYIVQRGREEKYYEVFLSSSNDLIFRVQSGSLLFSASCPFSTSYMGVGHHFAFCYSSASAATNVYVDGALAFVTSSAILSTPLIVATGSLTVESFVVVGCSQSHPPPGLPRSGYITGSIDELRVWNSYRTADQVAQYYNRHIHWEPELIFYLKFNEPHYTMSNGAYYYKFQDYSKRPIDCNIINPSAVSLGSNKQSGVLVDATGSNILIDNYYDPMIYEDHDDVTYYIQTIWDSADTFDKNNRNIITDLVPYNYIEEETTLGSYNLINLLYLFARQLDEMKLHIQHFGNLWKRSYDSYDVIPFKLLQEAIELFGFESFDNFPLASIDSVKKNYYVNETNVLAIKEVNEIFWRNLLANLTYIYKTKGTRESINSFLHCLGIDENVVSVKDYSSQYSYPVSQSYINKYRYSKTLDFMTGLNTGSYVSVLSSQFPPSSSLSSSLLSIETLVSFKPYSSYESGTFYETIVTSQPHVIDGSIWGVKHSVPPSTGSGEFGLFFSRDVTSSYGDIRLITSGNYDGIVTRINASNVPVFDGNYYNIAYRRSGSNHYLDVKKLEDSGYVENIYSGSCTFTTSSTTIGNQFVIGGFCWSTVTPIPITETKQTEVRLWDCFLSSSELDAHCMNYTSVGIRDPEYRYIDLIGHWILDDGIVSDGVGTIYPITNYSYYKERLDATGFLFLTSSDANFAYELLPYNYLCPDLSLKWNVNKIQYSTPSDIIDEKDRVDIFSVEFNAVDSLNEDIIRLFSDLNKFSNLIGTPILKNKNHYDLERYMNEVYFTRLSKSLSFLNYFRNLSWIDKFYFNIIERLIPARLYFIGEEKVIESHLLERNKVLGQISKESVCYTGLGSAIRRS
jgi:hypothetical protein